MNIRPAALLTLVLATRLAAGADAVPGSSLAATSAVGLTDLTSLGCALGVASGYFYTCAGASEGGEMRKGLSGPTARRAALEDVQPRASTTLTLKFGHEDPTSQLLEAVKLCNALAHMNPRNHWQTNALSGVALGATTTYWLQQRDNPLVLHLVRRGIYVGIERQF